MFAVENLGIYGSAQWPMGRKFGEDSCEERLSRQDRGTNPVWLAILQIGGKEEKSAIHD